MTRQEKDRYINMLRKSREEEIEEVEKGIVLATMQLESMIGINADLKILGGIRLRRAELEEEWEKLKRELSDLNAGIMPDMDKTEQKVRRAAEKLQEALEAGEKLKVKAGDAVDMHKKLHEQLNPDNFKK